MKYLNKKRKAFGSILRGKLFQKLRLAGVTGCFLEILHSMYSNDKSSVKIENMVTPAFRCHTGVKQGCMLSPTLFNLYLSDLSEELKAKNLNDVELNELTLSCMLYADDLVIFSKSKNGLQDYLDSLSEYCKENDLSVNLNKIKVLIFNNCGRTMNKHVLYFCSKTKFIRWLLGVNKFCSSNACRSEVGRFPMQTKTKCRAIKYWLKLCEPEHQNKLSGIAFTDQIGQDKKELWSSKLKRLLNLAGLGDIWSAKTNTPAIMSYIRQRLLDIEQQTWISEIQELTEHNDQRKNPHQKNKLRFFRKFKLTHDYENYVTNVRNINHRVAITKLRLSNHKLAIETGQYVKPYQPPEERICPLCKTGLEDEEHFLMNCIAHRDPRRELFNTLKKETYVFLDSVTPSSAFATLISMKQGEKTQKIVAKYVCDRFRERDRRVKYNLV
ncbi:uncharacterized protein [Porites lutea]|uniref:uncharacterized protein n=1 Tax=Porites lutea TaxID=51062 RepID=UPI003CC5E595